MARILIHCSHPVDAKVPITAFSFTVEYGEGSYVRFADLPIPPSSDAHSIAAFRQELRRLATAILNVAASGKDIHWDRSANFRSTTSAGHLIQVLYSREFRESIR